MHSWQVLPSAARSTKGAPITLSGLYYLICPVLVGLSALEFFSQCIRIAGEQAYIGANRDEQVAPLDIPTRLFLVAGQDAGRFVEHFEPLHRIFHRLLHVSMLRIAKVSQRCRQIRRTDKHAIDTFYFCDRFELVESAVRFDLNQNANFSVRLGQIPRDAAVTAGPRRNRDSANPMWWITRRGDRAFGLFHILHIGEQQRLSADVERALCQYRIVPCRPNDWRCRATLHGL